MTIAWLTREAEPFPQQSGPGIQILIPGEQTACHIVYANADGREQRVFVRGPQVAIIPADQPYALECEPRPDILVITLDPMFFEMKAHEALGGEPSLPMRRCAAVDPFIRELGNTLKRELEMLRMPPAAYLECVAAMLASHLATHLGSEQTPMQSHDGLAPHKLKRVQGFIAEHFAEALRLEQLARFIHMSPFHFARMFKRATGKPPHAYLTAQRMEHAKALLRDGQLPLVDVAASVGFQTQGHFTTVFRRHCGVTPRIFRMHCQSARCQSAPSCTADETLYETEGVGADEPKRRAPRRGGIHEEQHAQHAVSGVLPHVNTGPSC